MQTAPRHRTVLHGNPGHTASTFARAIRDLRAGDRVAVTLTRRGVVRGTLRRVYGSKGIAIDPDHAGGGYYHATDIRHVEPEADHDARLTAADAERDAIRDRAALVDEIANEIADARLAGDVEREAAAKARLAEMSR